MLSVGFSRKLTKPSTLPRNTRRRYSKMQAIKLKQFGGVENMYDASQLLNTDAKGKLERWICLHVVLKIYW